MEICGICAEQKENSPSSLGMMCNLENSPFTRRRFHILQSSSLHRDFTDTRYVRERIFLGAVCIFLTARLRGDSGITKRNYDAVSTLRGFPPARARSRPVIHEAGDVADRERERERIARYRQYVGDCSISIPRFSPETRAISPRVLGAEVKCSSSESAVSSLSLSLDSTFNAQSETVISLPSPSPSISVLLPSPTWSRALDGAQEFGFRIHQTREKFDIIPSPVSLPGIELSFDKIEFLEIV